MSIDLKQTYKIIKPVILVLCGLWIVLDPLSTFVEHEFKSYAASLEIALNAVYVLYYALTIIILYFVSSMQAAPLLKILIAIGVIAVFQPISMLLLMLFDKELKKGLINKNTSANRVDGLSPKQD